MDKQEIKSLLEYAAFEATYEQLPDYVDQIVALSQAHTNKVLTKLMQHKDIVKNPDGKVYEAVPVSVIRKRIEGN